MSYHDVCNTHTIEFTAPSQRGLLEEMYNWLEAEEREGQGGLVDILGVNWSTEGDNEIAALTYSVVE
tara:strand:+ start:514 stop:714 length:201 start_codon:yes stop_codon:yes gene_type:complete